MTMTLTQQRDVIQAAIDGKNIEKLPISGVDGTNWSSMVGDRLFDFARYDYRVKPPALRPHYPAITRDPIQRYMVSGELFPQDNLPVNIIGFIRLATEYPPVMLP